MWGTRRAAFAAALLPLLVPVTPAAAAKKQPKPSLKVVGVSPNRWFTSPGRAVKLDDGTNGCYVIAGPTGAPTSLQAFFFVRTVRLPSNAPTTLTITTPWDAQTPDLAKPQQGKLSSLLYRSKGRPQAGIFGGPQGPYDRYTYRMLPTGGATSYYVSGKYSIDVSVKVGPKTYHAAGAITVAC